MRILCAQEKQGEARPWWANYPETLTNHVRVRTVLKHDIRNSGRHKRGFHDRYLITPEHEIVMTHSFNGWCEDGVTFITLPFEVYRAEAEEIWSMDFESATAPVFVEDLTGRSSIP